MSLQAISWALDCSQAAGNERLVMIVLAHHSDELGYAGLSKATLADETRLSEDTITRAQQSLVRRGEIEQQTAPPYPDWYTALPANRRPRLFLLVAFLESPFAVPVRARRGAALRPRGGRAGGKGTASDQDVSGANTKPRISNAPQLSENEKPPDPDCPRCLGVGAFQAAEGDASYGGTGAFKRRCTCTFVRDPALALVEGT